MTRSARCAGALLAATLACAGAQAVPVNIGSSNGLTWELLRFAGPDSPADATFGAGVRTKIGVVPGDYCAGADENCGTAMSFATRLGGALMVGASDDADGAVNTTLGLALQELASPRGGLGVVSRSAAGAVSGHHEINRGDALTLVFANTVRLAGLRLARDGDADPNVGTATFGLAIDGGTVQRHTLQDQLWWGDNSTLAGQRFTFSHINADYHLGAIEIVGAAATAASAAAAVPEPQGTALLLLGLVALGAVARRRRPH